MKTKFFFLALAAALSMQANADQAFRHADNVMDSTPTITRATINASEIPAGMALVSLEAHDVWGDGTGYQLLLDADANAYGNLIPETGALALYTSVADEVYAEFEYKIPENADGSLYTENVVYDGIISILVPAGTYDWCITNPEPGYAMWIASDYGMTPGRYDDYQFEEGKEYHFSVYMTYYGYDGVDLEVIDGTPVTPPVDPTEKTGAPTFHGYTEDGIHAYFVEIIPTEESVIYYRIIYPDGTETEWAE
jgi:gingipain R/gingipain K